MATTLKEALSKTRWFNYLSTNISIRDRGCICMAKIHLDRMSLMTHLRMLLTSIQMLKPRKQIPTQQRKKVTAHKPSPSPLPKPRKKSPTNSLHWLPSTNR